ncbi:hypothetical protein [Ruania rhizosphaerae]|uniref:hypothetical protein n=1 Tax=Ruania rhizosphaerae TaxID=1840413 RepID=UPI001F2E963F|nr:hypothetical protein [Ruania rhizosphaerae]
MSTSRTPDPGPDRMESPRCTARSKGSGEQCKRRPAIGQRVCAVHGGKSPQAKKAAARRIAEAEARAAVVTFGLPVDVAPSEALLEEVRWTAGHVQWLRGRVQQLEPDALTWGETKRVDKGSGAEPGIDTTEAAAVNVWLDLYYRERAHFVAVCTAALKAGVEERRVRLAEQQGELVAVVIRRILDDLQLTPAQAELAPGVAARHLRAIAGDQPSSLDRQVSRGET